MFQATELAFDQCSRTIGFARGPDLWPKVSIANQLIFRAHFDTDVQAYSAFIDKCQSYGG